MSRSKKKHLFLKIAGNSNKKDRTIANKRLRKINKLILKNAISNDNSTFTLLREISDTWNFNSDGLAYYTGNKFRRTGEPFTIEELHRFFGK